MRLGFEPVIAISLLAGMLIAPARAREQESEAFVRRAVSLMNVARPGEAEDLLATVIAKDPKSADARILLGYLYLRRSALDEAERTFQEALVIRPQDASARLGLGMTWAQKGRPGQAAQEFERLLEDRSLGHKARVQWIYSLFLQGKDDAAFREALDGTTRFSHVAEYHNILGFLHHLRGNHGEALREYRRSAAVEPFRLETYFSLIAQLRIQGDWNAALEATTSALQLDPDHPLLYRELSFIHQKLGRTSDAREARREAERTFEAEVLFTRANAARRAGRYDEAESLIRKSLESNPRMPKTWAELGNLLRERGQLDEARAAYSTALERDRTHSPAHLGLAATFQEQGKEVEAEEAYRRARARGVSSPDLHAGLAAAYLDQGRAREAAGEMLRAISDWPDNPDLLSYLGYIHQTAGNLQEAEGSFKAALRLNPLQLHALLGRGEAALAAGNPELAVRSFRQATEIDPDRPEAWHGLIRAYTQAQRAPEARDSGRNCLERLPAETGCREQLARLLMEASDYRGAAGEFEHLLRSGHSSKSILDGLGFSLLNSGATDQAIDLFHTSLRRYGTDAVIHSNLGYAYRIQGNLSDATPHYRKARDLAPNDPERHHDLAFALYLQRNYQAAVEPFQAATRLRPRWGLAHYNLAMNYWQLGSYVLALAHARVAQEEGVGDAGSVVRALSAHLSLDAPANAGVRPPER